MKQSLLNALLIAAVLIGCAAQASAALPVTGVPIEKLSWIDKAMVNHMTSNGITGGVIGVMRNGDVIFQRGYGWKDQARTIAMPENALVRLASCTKPITAAAIRKLEAAGRFEPLGLNSYVFALGQTTPGIINVTPFLGAAESVDLITIQHCLSHKGGWNRCE